MPKGLTWEVAQVVGVNGVGGFLFGGSFFAYSWKLPACNGAFLLTTDNFSFLLTIGALCLQLELFCLQWESV